MSKWNARTLAQICEEGGGSIQTGPFGSQLHAEEYSGSGIPVVMPQDIGHNVILNSQIARVPDSVAARLSRHRLSRGDIVFSRRGDVTRRAIVRPENAGWLCGTGCLRIRPGDAVDADFLAYALGTSDARDWLLGNAVGTNMLNLNTGILGRLPLSLPGLSEQRAIAEVLGALDDKIAANCGVLSRADELIAAQFKRALAQGPRSAPLLEELKIGFGEPFGGNFFSAPGSGRPLIRIRDLKSFDSQVWTTESRDRETTIDAGDVLVGMDAEFRATTWLGERGVLNQRVLRASHERYGNAIVREVLRQPLSEIENEKSATTVIHLNKSDLARKSVMMPVETALLEFERLAEPLYDARVALAKENRTLAATRDALLPQLMSGKLRVRDAEAIAADAGA